MKNLMLSDRKKKESRKRFLTSNLCNFFVITIIMIFYVCMATCYADALDIAKRLLSKGATGGGGLWAVWGLVQLGISIKDNNGPGIQGAIWQIIGGGIIIAAGKAISSLDLSFAA